jgi:hypothetical protein
MVIIKPYQSAVSLFGADGSVRVFKSLEHAYRELGERFIGSDVGREFCVFRYATSVWTERAGEMVQCREPVYDYYRYVLRDDAGCALTIGDFAHLRARRRHRGRYGFALATWNGEGSVPGIGRLRGGHYFRRMHTMAERRAAQLMDECEVAPRAARNASNLPNSWDDHHVRSREDRSWKRFRKTRWKAV